MCWLICSTQAQCQTQIVCSVFIKLMIQNKTNECVHPHSLQFLWSLPLFLPHVSLDQLLSLSSCLKRWASTWSQTSYHKLLSSWNSSSETTEDRRRAEFLFSQLRWVTRVTDPCLLPTLNSDQTALFSRQATPGDKSGECLSFQPVTRVLLPLRLNNQRR